MSLRMRRIKRNAIKLVIQQQNHIHRRKRKTMWIYHVEELENQTKPGNQMGRI